MDFGYTLGLDLGLGAFGRVIKASKNGRDVAIKILLADTDKLKDRARIESSLHKSLHHPHIVQFIESFQNGDNYWIILEFINGSDLSKWRQSFTSHPPDEHEVLSIFVQILQAVQYLHHHNIVHRDLKPANIFLAPNRSIKIGDFGSAEHCPSSQSLIPVGTIGYIAPEVLHGEAATMASDVFSLGCVFFELCSLRNACDFYTDIHNGKMIQMPKQFTPGLKNLLRSMLEIDPTVRPTVSEILGLPLFQRIGPILFDLKVLRFEKGEKEEEEEEKCVRKEGITDRVWDQLKAVKEKKESALIRELEVAVADQIGMKQFQKVKYHVLNEFDDMNSAEFIREYAEVHEDHVRMMREIILLEEGENLAR
jgi:serine/threonine protein kinase